MFFINKIYDKSNKSNITNCILKALPEWFGIEESIVEYTNEVKNTDFYVAYDSENPIGFISIKSNNKHTSEIYVIGVLKEYQNKCIGKQLLKVAEKDLLDSNVKFLMVKTLGDSHPDEHYKKTRKFYYKVGFYPLEEIKEIWDEKIPCLIMVKSLKLN